MLNHGQTERKIRAMYQKCHDRLRWANEAEVPAALRGRMNSIKYLMPLAHVVCDSNKSRAMIGYLIQNNFEPGKTPEPDTWFKPADFMSENRRLTQADTLDGLGIVSVFIIFESGHSNSVRKPLYTWFTARMRKTLHQSTVWDSCPAGLVEVATTFILLSTTA